MSLGSIDSVARLLSASNPEDRAQAWTAFVEAQSDVLLHVARAMGGDHDRVMDRYAFMLDALQQDDYRRLHSYQADGRATFTAWLIIVARRLCLDHHRQLYGRPQSEAPASTDRHRERRHLTDLIGDELSLTQLENPPDMGPDLQLEHADRASRLQCALARLDPEDRLILRLRFEDALSVPEITRLLRFDSPFRLYRRIDRTLATVREHLKELGVESAGA